MTKRDGTGPSAEDLRLLDTAPGLAQAAGPWLATGALWLRAGFFVNGLVQLAHEIWPHNLFESARAYTGVTWRVAECERRGVELRCGTEATPELVASLAPDAVVVATGAVGDATTEVAWHPPIAGVGGPGVLDHEAALRQAIADGPGALGARVVIADLVGMGDSSALAELLAAPHPATGAPAAEGVLASTFAGPIAADPETRLTLMRRARRAGATLAPHHVILGVEPSGPADSARTEPDEASPGGATYRVSLADTLAGSVRVVENVDTLVVRSPARSVDRLVAELQTSQPGVEVHAIGDAVAARWVDKAIADGHRVGRLL